MTENFNDIMVTSWWYGANAVANAVASQQEGPGFSQHYVSLCL